MQALKLSIVAALVLAILCASTSLSMATENLMPVYKLNPSWSSKRVDATLWGLARPDLDGDGTKELVVLERSSLWHAQIKGNELIKEAIYKLPADTEGLRVFAMDVDGEPGDEVVISAIAYEHPSSLIIKFSGGTFKELAKDISWHLRVLEKERKKLLIGQRSSLDEFFTGKIYELNWTDGKLKHVDPLPLPRRTKIFEFNFSSRPGENDALVSLKGYDRIKAYEQRGSKLKWKRFWISDTRFGGTLNIAEITTRPPTQDLPRYEIPINKEPVTFASPGSSVLMAVKQDLPLKNIIMKRPLIRGGRFVKFMYDQGLGFREITETERLPGFVSDFIVDHDDESGKAKLYVTLQTDPKLFQPGTQSTVLIFNLESP
jgi:hypothetical protein